jgi:hypothetical protein
MEKKLFTATRKRTAAGVAMTVLMMTSGAGRAAAQAPTASSGASGQNAEESKFYCNTKALSPAERAHHKEVNAERLRISVQSVQRLDCRFSGVGNR